MSKAKDTVMISRSEYERLMAKAGEGPEFPKPDAAGNVPAVEHLRASIARELIRRRGMAGLTQFELAALAGVRQETISRIESGKHTVTERTMAKIENALAGTAALNPVGRQKLAAMFGSNPGDRLKFRSSAGRVAAAATGRTSAAGQDARRAAATTRTRRSR